MANIYSDKTEDWTYYNTTRLDVHSFRFNGVGAYATTVIGNGGGDGGEDTEQELGGELVFRGVVSPAQSSLSQGLRCRIDIYSKQDAEQENWETESHFIYIKGDRNGAINQKVNVRNGAYDHINLKIEALSDAEMSLDNTIDLTSFIIHDAALIADLSVIREKIEEGETGLSTLEEETLNLFNVISGSLGFYSTVVEYEDGSKISYIHDKPKLENSMVIATQTESGWASTTTGWNDGEPAWTYGVTFDGSLVMNVVSAVGINAEWIKAGKITADYIDTTGLITQYLSNSSDLSGGYGKIGYGTSGGAGYEFNQDGHKFIWTFDVSYGVQLYLDNKVRFVSGHSGNTSIYDTGGVMRLQVRDDGGTSIYDSNGYTRLFLSADGGASIRDASGQRRFEIGADDTTYIYDENDDRRLLIADSVTELRHLDSTGHRLGVDTFGAYFVHSNKATYFSDLAIPKIQRGVATISTIANMVESQAVTFSTPFASAPTVMLTMAGTVPQRFSVSAHDITANGFTIYIQDTNTSTAYVRWLAVL